jgi:ABC-type lipopolysaccharide export system ATPase subunit
MHKLEADSIQLNFNSRPILSSIYIKIETGKVSALLGRNGAGKSCLMQIIYGQLACEKSIRIDGKYCELRQTNSSLILYLPQKNYIPRSLSLQKIFKDYQIVFSTFEEYFPQFKGKIKSCMGELSGGDARIVNIYCLLNRESMFLLLDEPFTYISPIDIEKIKNLISLAKETKGILLSDHQYKHVLDINDNVYFLSNGKTYFCKDEEDLKDHGYLGREV